MFFCGGNIFATEEGSMERISLVIVTDDMDYGRALSQALLQLCGGMLIRLAGKDEFFAESRKNAEGSGEEWFASADLILWDGDEAEEAYGGRIVLLSGKPSMTVKNVRENRFCLYRYSTAQVIAASLFEIYGHIAGKRTANVRTHATRLLAFASWTGGSGCTSVAMSVCQELRSFGGSRVLYLSFEEIESTGEFMGSAQGVRGAGMYLYYLFKSDSHVISSAGEDAGLPSIEGHILHDDFGLEAFAPAAGRNPLAELSEDELDVFMASVIDSGRYDVIVMDLGTGLSSTSVACMTMAERICFVAKSGESYRREEQYIQHIVHRCGEEIMDKAVKAENMAAASEEELHRPPAASPMIDADVRIGMSSTFVQRGDVRRIFLDGRYGRDIKRLTAILTESAESGCGCGAPETGERKLSAIV